MLENSKIQFQKEQDELLQTILDNRFFLPWKERYQIFNDYSSLPEDIMKYHLGNDGNVEIYLSAMCNQNCEYCYLIKNKDLYPKELDNKENVLNNLAILFNHFIEENYYIKELEYYSGEIWHTQYGLDVLQLTYEAINNGLHIDSIMIPSNCSFIFNDAQMHKIQNFINDFKDIGIRLIFSISIDGKIIEEKTRPLNSKMIKDDEFYEKLFTFAQHNEYYFHPMVSSFGIKNWIENYNWWIEMCEKYDYAIDKAVMMLEVRNNDWTDESINDYNQLMKYIIDKNINKFGGIENFTKELFLFCDNDDEKYLTGYIPYSPIKSDTFAGCSVANTLTIRVGDLALCPCHRTAYNKYLYGHYKVENNKIVGIKALNPQMAVRILMTNNNLAHHGCDTCIFSKYCLKGCFGSQLEVTQDPFMPIDNICYFFKKKWKFLINYYDEIGVFNYLEEIANPYVSEWPEMQDVLNFANEVRNYVLD